MLNLSIGSLIKMPTCYFVNVLGVKKGSIGIVVDNKLPQEYALFIENKLFYILKDYVEQHIDEIIL